MRRANEPRAASMCPNTALSLDPGGGGLALRCETGLIVVTQKGDREDHELHPGDEFRTRKRGRVVAWSLPVSGFTVRDLRRSEVHRKAA